MTVGSNSAGACFCLVMGEMINPLASCADLPFSGKKLSIKYSHILFLI